MRTKRPLQSIIAIMFFLMAGCSPSQNLVGLWKTETQHQNISINGQPTTTVDVYQTVEFREDGSFKIENVVKAKRKDEKLLQWKGTFKVIDTNNVTLEIAPNSMQPNDKIPLHVQYAISNKFLIMTEITGSVMPGKNTYLRVR